MIARRPPRAALFAATLVCCALGGCMQRSPSRPGSTAASAPHATPPATVARPGGRYSQDRDSTPGGPPPDLSRIAEPQPKAEPRSQYGNKSPYTVLGETYRVLPSATGYVERGIASWYGNKFHGYTTSTLEKYDMYTYSAANKTLPLPSYARVTNLENGRSVVVRVNDRGPFVANRVIDLSYVAAVKIGVWPKGTAMVEVRAIDPAHPEPRAAAAVSTPGGGTATPGKTPKPLLYLQVGAYGDRGNAEKAAGRLRAARLGEVRVVAAQVGGRTVQRVRLGPIRDVDEADRLTPKVRAVGLGEPHVAIDDQGN